VLTDRDLGGDREDIRDLPLVTIDGEDARDFDDAVYCEPQGRGFKLWVAIADVSHYVQPGAPLDREGYNRGNSVYFPRRVIPMLPEELSNGLCSLNPEVDRLCMVCEMEISSLGNIRKYRFYPGVMHSKARLTYNQVWDWLSAGEGRAQGQGLGAAASARICTSLFKVLLKARAKRGAIDFETSETKMVFDDQDKIENIVPTVRNDAHRLIEECMLAANVCASEFLQEAQAAGAVPGPRRADAGEAEDVAGIHGGIRFLSVGRRRPSRQGLRRTARQDQGTPRRATVADRHAALPAPGRVQPGKRRPFRSRLRGLYPLHIADPALSRPAGAPRHQGHA
jgi:exoribonuclease II